jgi:hypothetical protein
MTTIKDDPISPELWREIRRINRQRARADAAGGVIPNREIVNRRTGYVQQFGRRTAFDGAYVGEVLAASGCWMEDIEKVLWVLSPLVENNCGDWTISDLVKVLPYVFHEQLTSEQWDRIRKAGKGASGRMVNGQFTITGGKPRLSLVRDNGDTDQSPT